PRPRNAFIFFRSRYVKEQKEAVNQSVMSCRAGEVWRGMTRAERLPYVQRAQEEKQAHA
ncbi:hypothetical protein B0H14DRAFT_2293107, partial [Mycena olivaceomarginata]